jgi:hypothetical protein
MQEKMHMSINESWEQRGFSKVNYLSARQMIDGCSDRTNVVASTRTSPGSIRTPMSTWRSRAAWSTIGAGAGIDDCCAAATQAMNITALYPIAKYIRINQRML